jgi:hypothetical protein
MGVFKRGNTLWVRYRDIEGNWRNASTGYVAGQEKLAEATYDELASRIRSATAKGEITVGPLTVRRWAEGWIRERRKLDLDWHNDDSRLRHHVLPVIGDMKIADARTRHIIDLFHRIRTNKERPVASRTVHSIYSTLTALFRDAKLADKIEQTPCSSSSMRCRSDPVARPRTGRGGSGHCAALRAPMVAVGGARRAALGLRCGRGAGPRGGGGLGSRTTRLRAFARRRLAVHRSRLQIGDDLAQELRELLALRALARVPRRPVGAPVGDLELVTDHLGHVAVGIELGDDLVGHDVPVIRGADRRTGALGCAASASFDDGIPKLPAIGCDLALGPLAGVVPPLVAAPDPHAGVALARELLDLVVA